MILETALSEKNEEKASLPLPNKFGHSEVVLYPCLRCCKGGNCSSQLYATYYSCCDGFSNGK